MPRYDVPKLADYSGALNANNSMIQAFANLGKTSQDYLNYDEDKKKNEWYQAFKTNTDQRDYDHKVEREAVADKQWQDEYTANKDYKTKNLDIQRQIANNRGSGGSSSNVNPYQLAQMQKILYELDQRQQADFFAREDIKKLSPEDQQRAWQDHKANNFGRVGVQKSGFPLGIGDKDKYYDKEEDKKNAEIKKAIEKRMQEDPNWIYDPVGF